MMLSYILVAISFTCVGVLLMMLYQNVKSPLIKEPVNPFKGPDFDMEKNRGLFELYLKEWNIIIKTQMHFNDLILRFRSFVLTAFFAILSAIVAVQKTKLVPLNENEYLLLLLIPVIFWMTAFLIDFFYYHKMLIGAVAQAKKFDDNEVFASNGFFGLTKCISEHVTPPISRALVIIYYFLPLLCLGILYTLRRFYL